MLMKFSHITLLVVQLEKKIIIKQNLMKRSFYKVMVKLNFTVDWD